MVSFTLVLMSLQSTLLVPVRRGIVSGQRLPNDSQGPHHRRVHPIESFHKMGRSMRNMSLGHGHFPTFTHRQRRVQRGRKIVTVRRTARQGEIRLCLHRLVNDLPCFFPSSLIAMTESSEGKGTGHTWFRGRPVSPSLPIGIPTLDDPSVSFAYLFGRLRDDVTLCREPIRTRLVSTGCQNAPFRLEGYHPSTLFSTNQNAPFFGRPPGSRPIRTLDFSFQASDWSRATRCRSRYTTTQKPQ